MGKRKKTPYQLIDEYLGDITREQKRWDEIAKNGSSDLWYPDGVALNLVRNHIISSRNRCISLCYENGIKFPEFLYSMSIPQKVDQNYMVDPTSERAKRIAEMKKAATGRANSDDGNGK